MGFQAVWWSITQPQFEFIQYLMQFHKSLFHSNLPTAGRRLGTDFSSMYTKEIPYNGSIIVYRAKIINA